MSFLKIPEFITDFQIQKENSNTLIKEDKKFRSSFKFTNIEIKYIKDKYFPELTDNDLRAELFTQCMKYFTKEKGVVKVVNTLKYETDDIYNLEFTTPANKPNASRVICYDKSKDIILKDIKSREILNIIQEALGKEEYPKWKASNYSYRGMIYNPTQKGRYLKVDGLEYINMYNRPAYQIDYDPNKDYKEPANWLAAMKSVIPIESQREVIEEIQYYCVANMRSKQAVIAVGLQGVGKGTLFNDTLRELVGRSNHFVLPNSFMKTKFDSGVANQTVAIGEELEFKSTTVKNKLKNLIGNDIVTVEEKHVPAHESQPIYANFFFNSNYIHRFKYDLEDRLFLIPDLGKQMLINAFSVEWVRDYKESLKDPETLREIYHYLMNKFGHIDNPRILKMESETEKIMIHQNDTYLRRAFLWCAYHASDELPDEEDHGIFTIKQVKEKLKEYKLANDNSNPTIRLDELVNYCEVYERKFGFKLAEYDATKKRFKSFVYKDGKIGKYIK